MRNRKSYEVRDTLNIHSLKHLSLQTGVSEDEITDICDNIDKHYSCKKIITYKDDGSEKIRAIYHPSERLERLLKAISCYLLKKIKLSDPVHGSRKRHSNITNAEVHCGKRYVFKLDIENYFPSISSEQLYSLFKQLRCSQQIAGYLSVLCTADNHLPQGYSSSPYLANLILLSAIKRIERLCKKQGLIFTSYVDDLTISGNKNPEPFFNTIKKIIGEYGYRLKTEKTECLKRSQQQRVTGPVVNVRVNIDRASYQEVKKYLHIAGRFGPHKLLGKVVNRKGERLASIKSLQEYLTGKINYIKNLTPHKAVKLQEMYKSVSWAKGFGYKYGY